MGIDHKITKYHKPNPVTYKEGYISQWSEICSRDARLVEHLNTNNVTYCLLTQKKKKTS